MSKYTKKRVPTSHQKASLPYSPQKKLVRSITQPKTEVRGARFGVELEVEGTRLPQLANGQWNTVTDGSLRNGLEYVSSGPRTFEEIENDLAFFDKQCQDAKLKPSIRTSTHVHLNVQSLTITRLISLLAVYYAIEDVLFWLFSENRRGNHFCMTASMSEDVFINLRRLLMQNENDVPVDNTKYFALNFMPLMNGGFGTLEFRHADGVKNSAHNEILPWVKFIKDLYWFSKKFPKPSMVYEQISLMGPVEFFKKYFPDLMRQLEKTKDWDPIEAERLIYFGVDHFQPFAHLIQWDPDAYETISEPRYAGSSPNKKKWTVE